MEDSEGTEGGEDVEVCGEGAEDGGFTVDEEGVCGVLGGGVGVVERSGWCVG